MNVAMDVTEPRIAESQTPPLLEVNELSKAFPVHAGFRKKSFLSAVDKAALAALRELSPKDPGYQTAVGSFLVPSCDA